MYFEWQNKQFKKKVSHSQRQENTNKKNKSQFYFLQCVSAVVSGFVKQELKKQ